MYYVKACDRSNLLLLTVNIYETGKKCKNTQCLRYEFVLPVYIRNIPLLLVHNSIVNSTNQIQKISTLLLPHAVFHVIIYNNKLAILLFQTMKKISAVTWMNVHLLQKMNLKLLTVSIVYRILPTLTLL